MAALWPQLMIREPDLLYAVLPSDIYAVWVGFSKLNSTRDSLKNQTATRKQWSNGQQYRLDIKRFRLVNNRQVRSVFVANKQGLFQAPTSVPCDSSGITNSLQARYVNALV